MAEVRKISFGRLVLYGLGDIFGGGSFAIIGMLFMFFLTEFAGLKPFTAGLVFAAGKFWDAVSDPIMGYLSDRTSTRFGRRRVYFLAGFIPVGVSFALLWVSINTASVAVTILYYSFAYILFSTVFTMVMVPYAALNADMTPDYKDRTRLSGARIIFSQVSGLVAATLPKIIIDSYADQRTGFVVMGIAFGLFYALPWLPVFFGTWERPEAVSSATSTRSAGIFRNFGTIFRNRSLRIHIGMYVAAYSAMDVLMALFMYYLVYVLNRDGVYSLAMGSVFIIGIFMLPVYVVIANRRGKGAAFRVGLSLWMIGMLIAVFVQPESSLALLLVACVTIGLGVSACVMMPWAILPSVVDVDELITGKNRAGIYSGAITLIRKAVQGLIAMPLVGLVLQLIGFVSNQPQSPETVVRLRLVFFAGPVVFLAAGFLVSLAFKITPATHDVVRKELERFRAGGKKEDADDETIATAELLTGLPWSELHGGGEAAE